MTIRQGRRGGIDYPESDGKPMGETEVHVDELMRLLQTLRDAFADRADAYVAGNMMFYWEEGNPRASVSPDVFVVFGVAKRPPRRVFKVWEEAVPVTVFEITSRSTRREDLGKKRVLYANLGVREYYLYDPLGEYLRPALQGFRLEGGDYRPIAPEPDGALVSEALGMRLLLVDGRLRLFDRQTGAPVLSPSERAAVESAARRAAEAHVAELEALLARRRANGRDGQEA